MTRFLIVWLAVGWAGLLVVPWYGLDAGISPPALFAGNQWLLPLALPLLLATWASRGRTRPRALVAAGTAGLVWLAAEGLLIVHRGWAFAWLTALLGAGPSQPAMGWGAVCYALACLMLLAYGLARLGACKGDVFVVGAILLVVGLIALFVFYPVLCILSSAVRDNDGSFAPSVFADKAAQPIDLGSRTACSARAAAAWRGTRWPRQLWSGCSPRCSALAFALVATAHAAADEAAAARTVYPADHHTAVRHRPGADPAVRPRRRGHRVARQPARHSAQPLDLRHARHHHRAGAGVHADRHDGAAGRAAGRRTEPGGSLADAAGQPLVHLPHRHLAADPARPRQRLPDRLHREHGGFRQSAGDRRQLQRAVHRYLLRRGRRLARSGPRGGARHRAAGIHADRIPRAALLARPAQLRDRRRQGPHRHPRLAAGRRARGLLRGHRRRGCC